MTEGSAFYNRKIFLSLLILFGLMVSVCGQDKKISGKINVYRHVESFGAGLHPDNLTLNSVDSISPGDTVLLIQMQGVGIATDQNAYGGAIQTQYGEPGGYEFLIVLSVNTGTKNVVFRNNVITNFDARGNVQLIRVPYYNTATVTGTLTAKSWDATGTGGVVAMIVGRRLKLEADIDVSGKGFMGGKDTIGDGLCINDSPLNGKDSYPKTWTDAGYKGEGLAIHDEFAALLAPLHVKGQGINFTGGGGGNGKYSGGGGGSGRGKGGAGGIEKNFGVGPCAFPLPGGYGGTTVIGTSITDGIHFGGGGGASTHALGSTGSNGGNGGGIVIIIADTILGNRHSIKADGSIAGNAIADGGAGGGGAGGAVVLSLQSFSNISSDSLKVSVKGGNGGTNPGGYGTGGGGGGGLVWVTPPSIPGKVTTKINYGTPGLGAEGNGEIKYSFTPKLNGFLFNSIRSDVTGNQIDSICSNMSFGVISGTLPVGGTGPGTYSFLWQSSTSNEFTGYITAAGTSNQQNYNPGTLTQSTWFRRVVKDSGIGVNQLIDTSKAVFIKVQPFIKNNIVGTSDTICMSQDPPAFLPKAVLADGNGIYAYKWQVSTNSSVYNTPANTYNTAGYTPPPAPGYYFLVPSYSNIRKMRRFNRDCEDYRTE